MRDTVTAVAWIVTLTTIVVLVAREWVSVRWGAEEVPRLWNIASGVLVAVFLALTVTRFSLGV